MSKRSSERSLLLSLLQGKWGKSFMLLDQPTAAFAVFIGGLMSSWGLLRCGLRNIEQGNNLRGWACALASVPTAAAACFLFAVISIVPN